MENLARPFIVYALPRSRTAWLAQFLTYGDFTCAHEQTRHLRFLGDVRAWLAQDWTGTTETAAAPWWRLVQHIRPDVRVLVIRRPVPDVVDSLMRLDLSGVIELDRAKLTADMGRLDRCLDRIAARVPGALTLAYRDLDTEAGCARAFQHCLPYRHDPAWWAACAPVNVQAPMRALMRHHLAHRALLERLARDARAETLAILHARRPVPAELDGMVIQAEPFDTFWRDGQALIREHAAEVGPRDGVILDLDEAAIRRLDAAGALQVVTARCNGRLFGYLVTGVVPSLEQRGQVQAWQGPMFVSRDARGVGPRLQSASLALLRARSVDEVILRAGVRGSGPKAGALYRRLGAREFGRLYNLPLEKVA